MSVEFGCPSCEKRYRVDDRFAGKKAECKGCGAMMAIPALPYALPDAPSYPPALPSTIVPISPQPTACPDCGRENALGTKFCTGCGRSLIAAPPAPAAQAVIAIPSGMVACFQCGRTNPSGTKFCTQCGRALPAEFAPGPRVVSGIDSPTTELARSVMSEDLAKQISKACWALLLIAVIQSVATPLILKSQLTAAQIANPNGHYFIKNAAYAQLFAVSLAFWILFVWAMRSPLPAAIVGLTLYVTLLVLDVVQNPAALFSGWLMKIVVVAMLGQAIAAGVKYRKLSRGPAEVAT